MLRSLLLPLAAAAAFALTPCAQSAPTGFVIDTLVSAGLGAPHDFCFLPDGRVLIANRAGVINLFVDGQPLATVGNLTTTVVETGSERGLLSIEADPDFATNGYFYVWYSSNTDTFLKLDRYTCTGDLANPSSTSLSFTTASRRAVLTAVPDSAFNHNGGSVRFGPDGMLYLSIGDDAVACNAQSTTSSVGCVLRMNVDVAVLGTIPSTVAPSFSALDPGNNPLSANGDISQLVIAHGLRNPFRMEIDQLTGNLYIGDVGLSTREEYTEYVYPASGPLPLRNFGWPWREGLTSGSGCGGSAPVGMVDPIADVGSPWDSIMGGPRYRNQGGQYDFGSSFEGDGFFLDYFDGALRRIDHTGTAWGAVSTWASGYVGVTSLRQGPDGALWFTQHPNTYATSGGSLKRIRPLGPTNSVQAISGTGQVGPAGEAYAQPLVARVFDTNNNPLPGGTVNFVVTGPGILTTTNPVIADANGFAQTSVIATGAAGGAITVTASTPGSQTSGTFSLFARRLTITPAGNLLVVSFTNTTTAVPAQVPLIVMMSFPQTPVLPTFFGPVFTNPYVSSTLVLEDSFQHFPIVGWNTTPGQFGTPGLSKVYTVPAGLLTGQRMTFQLVGFDPVTGWFRSNVETRQF